MPKIVVGSFTMSSSTPQKLLNFINDEWKQFYDKEWNSGRYFYEAIKNVNDIYFSENFVMTQSEAEKELERIHMKGSQLWLYVKFKLKWYSKYGPKNFEDYNPNQMTLDDYLEEENGE